MLAHLVLKSTSPRSNQLISGSSWANGTAAVECNCREDAWNCGCAPASGALPADGSANLRKWPQWENGRHHVCLRQPVLQNCILHHLRQWFCNRSLQASLGGPNMAWIHLLHQTPRNAKNHAQRACCQNSQQSTQRTPKPSSSSLTRCKPTLRYTNQAHDILNRGVLLAHGLLQYSWRHAMPRGLCSQQLFAHASPNFLENIASSGPRCSR